MTEVNSTTERQTHSPGPWAYVPNNDTDRGADGSFIVECPRAAPLTGGTWGIATIWHQSGGAADSSQDEANARLIAAAPELLETMKALMQWVELETDDRDWPHAHLIAARDVVRKAEGVQ